VFVARPCDHYGAIIVDGNGLVGSGVILLSKGFFADCPLCPLTHTRHPGHTGRRAILRPNLARTTRQRPSGQRRSALFADSALFPAPDPIYY
ncbi:hypothetical protein ABTB76_19275, partial [Acinetobacter baumannii]